MFQCVLLTTVKIVAKHFEIDFIFFSKLENDCLMNFQSSSVRNIEKHVFRLSLSYLQSLSTTISGEERFLLSELETHQQNSAPWLDRSKFRKKLVEHGNTIGLQCSEINLILPVVEESAVWLRKWCPADTKLSTLILNDVKIV